MCEKTRNTESDSNTNNIEKNKNTEDVSYDQLIESAGEFGKYQLFLFFCTFPFYVYGVFAYFSQLFLTEDSQEHWCWIPELENLTDIQRRNLAIPLDENSPFGYSRCQAYEANWTEVLASGGSLNQTWRTVPCQNGWEFNRTEFPYPTITSELGWVCDKDSYQATAQSLFFVGSIIGGFIVGWVGDRFGRLPAAIFSNMIGAIAGAASTFTQSFTGFAICRLIMGMSYDNCMIMTYIIVLEYISPKYRTLITNLSFSIFYTLGAVALPWIALACGHWKTLSLATSLPMGLAILAPLIIPESPRWLLSKGRVNDAVNKVLRIAEVNKKEVPQELIEKFKESLAKNKEEPGNIMELLKRPVLRKVFLCTCLEYMCCMIIFDSLVRTIGLLKFDFFISFSVISLTEFPSILILSFALDFTGRKFMSMAVMVLCAIFSFLIPFVGGGVPSVICAVVARFGVNMAANTAMQWTAEMLPTSVRSSGTSIVHICGYVSTVISPFVAYLEIFAVWLPMIVIGCIAASAVFICLVLPETAQKEMPQTFEDSENLISSQGLLEIPFLQKNNVHNNMQGRANDSFELN
ncbi:solute carrier family 22 member 13-like [Anticarsia gemmatalis]|uniref:solute carrier family 22 member 13-like n=1 Tax=Anticarsia gemmatalis TaxID=129554 RepID=UPI003F7725A3